MAFASALSLEAGSYRGRLARLDLSETRLTAVGLASLLRAASKNSYLKILDVGGNEQIGCTLIESPETVEDVTSALQSITGLTDLHVWRCGLTDPACQLVVDAQPQSLSLLNLAVNPFSLELRNRLMRRHGYGAAVALRL